MVFLASPPGWGRPIDIYLQGHPMEALHDLSARHELVDEYREYAERLTTHLIRFLRLPEDRHDEFVSAAYLGLVEAASRFDFSSGASFRSYAFLRIRGAVIDSIRETADLSGKAYHRLRAFEAAHDLREQIASEPDSPRRELATEKLSKIMDFAATASLSFRLSLYDAEIELSLRDETPADPARILESRELTEKIREFVETLPENERNVIRDYYFHGLPFSQIAETYGRRSKSWVSRVHKKALMHLHEQVVAYHAGLSPPPPGERVARVPHTGRPRRPLRV
ncbi:MAG: hypothetical protein RL417_2187 [Pseudomonadota bacterium]|jgi:RNA polymerase sigma factor for flagellar operon FliA